MQNSNLLLSYQINKSGSQRENKREDKEKEVASANTDDTALHNARDHGFLWMESR